MYNVSIIWLFFLRDDYVFARFLHCVENSSCIAFQYLLMLVVIVIIISSTIFVPCVGHDTKALLNNTGLRAKRSKLEKDINLEVVAQLILLLLISVGGAIGEQQVATLGSHLL